MIAIKLKSLNKKSNNDELELCINPTDTTVKDIRGKIGLHEQSPPHHIHIIFNDKDMYDRFKLSEVMTKENISDTPCLEFNYCVDFNLDWKKPELFYRRVDIINYLNQQIVNTALYDKQIDTGLLWFKTINGHLSLLFSFVNEDRKIRTLTLINSCEAIDKSQIFLESHDFKIKIKNFFPEQQHNFKLLNADYFKYGNVFSLFRMSAAQIKLNNLSTRSAPAIVLEQAKLQTR